MRQQHLAILSDNKPGVLTHIAALISRKAINIESLTVGYTEEKNVSRFSSFPLKTIRNSSKP